MSLDLEPIKALEAAATPAPWRYDGGQGFDRPEPMASHRNKADAEFIAAARTDIPALVAEVERLREALDLINRVRSNVIATQNAGWSNTIYPLVAILNGAGFELNRDVSDDDKREHLNTYGGAGGVPGQPARRR